jgi:hypothetical protein
MRNLARMHACIVMRTQRSDPNVATLLGMTKRSLPGQEPRDDQEVVATPRARNDRPSFVIPMTLFQEQLI